MSKFLDVAIEAAKRAEEIIVKHYQPDIAVEIKSDRTPVTIADKQSEQAIIATIKSYFPDHAILGEEFGNQAQNSDYLWVIDPIDGTKNYSRHIPLFGTQIALMEKGEVVVGLSNMPLLKEMMFAEKGSGAFLNNSPVHTSQVLAVQDAYVVHGPLHYFEQQGLLQALAKVGQTALGQRGFGDCWMYHLLSQGKVDIVIDASVKVWDIAAASLIITEAGGVVADFDGQSIGLSTTSFFATNAFLGQQARSIFKG